MSLIFGVVPLHLWADFEPMLAKLHATNAVLLLGTVDKPHCVHKTRRGPQGHRVAAGMAKVAHWHLLRSSVQGRGADLRYSPNGRGPAVRFVSRKPLVEIPCAPACPGRDDGSPGRRAASDFVGLSPNKAPELPLSCIFQVAVKMAVFLQRCGVDIA